MAQAYADGVAWGDAKQMLFERIDREIAPMRAHYQALINNPAQMDQLLLAGAEKARQLATPFIRELRHAVGLRALGLATQSERPAQEKLALPSFKQYREKDGQFYFKMVDAKGHTLLQSLGFTSPKEAGQAIARLQFEGVEGLDALANSLETLSDLARQQVVDHLQALFQSNANHEN